MKIIADTATLIPPALGQEQGLTVVPVCVSIDGQTYQDYTQMTTEDFLARIAQGGIPSSSQPAIGDMLEVLDATWDEIIFLTVGDGLSGAYQTALGAKSMTENPQRIHIVNSKTLAGPLRYMARKAVALKNEGCSAQEILAKLEGPIESSLSFVIPEDFDFLKRSGRLTPITAKIGGALKLLPVLTQTKDKLRISPIGIKRSWKAAVEMIFQRLDAQDVGAGWLISVSHAGTPEKAQGILDQVRERFPQAEAELLELSPGLITHGGPGCIVIQAARM